jgi:hypothetical protein
MIARLVRGARRKRWLNLAVVNLRFLIGFALIPAALKKVLGQPFTDPTNTGPFHDFLHAFRATGWFYSFVGIVQLTAAMLLFSQRYATIGALVALPILTAITAFCWSTQVVPTATVATLILLGTIGLVFWDYEKWRPVISSDHEIVVAIEPPIDLRLWARCGLAIFVLYLGSTVAHGGVYRPRGIELENPAFYILPVVMLLPVITYVIERRRRREL